MKIPLVAPEFRDGKHIICGSADMQLGNDVEISFCPECCVLDIQAMHAFSHALKTFKESGHKLVDVPEFSETDTKLPGEVIRAWGFYHADYAPGDEIVDIFFYIILRPDGAYETYQP